MLPRDQVRKELENFPGTPNEKTTGSKEDMSQTPTEGKDKGHELRWLLKGICKRVGEKRQLYARY